MGITQELVHYCRKLTYPGLPEEVIDKVKYFFLDFIAVACRGSQEDSSKSIYRSLREMRCGDRGGVIVGTKRRAPYLYAALAN